MQKYQGKKVTVLRPADPGDKDFKNGVEQVVIQFEDGTQKTVAKADVTDK